MKPGYIIEFKRKGFVSWLLGGLLKIFERTWSGWGWHLAIAWQQSFDGWYILEATAQGVKINWYSDKFLGQNTRAWEWLDEPPAYEKMQAFLQEHINRKYDISIYFWTAFAVIFRHYWNKPIPKLLDFRYSCWELAQEFSIEMGKPILSRYDVVIISDIMKALKGKTP